MAEDSAMPSRTLLDQTIYYLQRSAREVFSRARPTTRGSDSVTLEQFRAEWTNEKRRITDALRSGTYEFAPLRGVVIAKDKTKILSLKNARPISILTVGDRVVQRAMLHALWKSIRDRIYTPWSFGGIRVYHVRRNEKTRIELGPKSVRQAIERITELQDSGLRHVFETDIRDFYRELDRERLYNSLTANLPDSSLNWLLHLAITSELDGNSDLGDYANLWHAGTGIPQGGVLSPVLANYYLYDFDKTLCDHGFHSVRYVDDLVVMCDSEADARAAYTLARSELAKLNLEIHELDLPDHKGRVKSRICSPSEHFDFLGARIHKSSIQPTPEKWDLLKTCLLEITEYGSTSRSNFMDVVRCTNNTTQGWLASFSFCNISTTDIEDRVDRLVRERLSGWLQLAGVRSDRNPITKAQGDRLGLARCASVPIRPIRKK
jgi:RNA-directed DNA polymerase